MRSDKAVLCYIYATGHGLAHVCTLVGGLGSATTEGFQVIDTVVLPMVGKPFRSFSLSVNPSIGISDLNLMVGCNYLHVLQSAACRDFQRIIMLGYCLKAEHGINNSVRVRTFLLKIYLYTT
jgi:dTDP-glucose pyrophosphorylase